MCSAVTIVTCLWTDWFEFTRSLTQFSKEKINNEIKIERKTPNQKKKEEDLQLAQSGEVSNLVRPHLKRKKEEK